MYNIVVFSGGTGSVALQNGLFQFFGNTINLDIVINAYDNGKSTGDCRRVFDNSILGPSDLRKNQITQFSVRYAEELKDPDSVFSRKKSIFELRLSANSPKEYYKKAKAIVLQSNCFSKTETDRLLLWLDYFFIENNAIRHSVEGINFKSFSLSNIFYSACASLNNNSLSFAAREMAEILHIPNNVHLVSDVNLFLKAETESGYIIEDEGEIVAWDTPDDPIIRVFLETANGMRYIPFISEAVWKENKRIESIIADADIIIFSSGTQWSSLIPTYMHRGFSEAIKKSKAKKYLIMNNVQDADMKGRTANEICSLLNQYLNLKQICIVINNNAELSLRDISDEYLSITASLSDDDSTKHNPQKLVSTIFEDYYKSYIDATDYIFDLDGTLWNERGNESEHQIGIENLNSFPGFIVSGNSSEHLERVFRDYCQQKRIIDLYADYGNTHFSTASTAFEYLCEKFFLPDELVSFICSIDEYKEKINVRGKVILTIKPLTNRINHVNRLNELLQHEFKGEYIAKVAGNTSVDISYKDYSKALMLEIILGERHIDKKQTVFIGNELESGNETGISEIGIRTLQVNDVYECNVFLKVINYAFNNSGRGKS